MQRAAARSSTVPQFRVQLQLLVKHTQIKPSGFAGFSCTGGPSPPNTPGLALTKREEPWKCTPVEENSYTAFQNTASSSSPVPHVDNEAPKPGLHYRAKIFCQWLEKKRLHEDGGRKRYFPTELCLMLDWLLCPRNFKPLFKIFP